jgi:two-component system, NtrC family, response regulator HydG
VDTIACYEGSSPSVDFRPNRFIPIDGFTDTKLAMLAPFAPRGGVPPHLQPDLSLASARAWSKFAEGSTYCEALEIVRDSARLG